MRQPPRRMGDMLDRRSLTTVLLAGTFKGLICFLAFFLSYGHHAGETSQHRTAVTVTLASLIVTQIANIFSTRTFRPVAGSYLFSNPKLYLGVGSSLFFVLLISYVPFFQKYLQTGAPDAWDWVFVSGGALVYLAVLELWKSRQ